MAYSILQSRGANNGYAAGPITLSLVSNTTAGSAIIVALTSNYQNVSGVSDNKSNTYTKGVELKTAGRLAQIWYSANIANAGSSHQISITLSASAYISLCIYEISGLDANPLGATGTNSTTSATSLTVTLSATPASGGIIIGAWGAYHYPSTVTAGSGYTIDYDYHFASNWNLVAEHMTADGSANTAGLTWVSACDGQMVAAEFKLASAGGPFPWFFGQNLTGGMMDGGL